MWLGTSRHRDFGLFIGIGLLPALAMALFGFRALRGEEIAVREQMRLQLEEAAHDHQATWDRAIERLLDEPASWAQVAPAEIVELEAEPGGGRSAASRPECQGLAARVEREGARAVQRERLDGCPRARTASGRMLWPLVALDGRVDTEPERLVEWFAAHGAELEAAERVAIRREILTARGLNEDARARVLSALEAAPIGSAERYAAAHWRAMAAGDSRIDWIDARSMGQLRRQDGGRYRGFVIHAGSIARAVAQGWPAVEGDITSKLVLGPSSPEGPSVRLLPGAAHLVMAWRDPDAVTHRTTASKRLLIALAALASLLVFGLAAILFTRMRAERRLSALRTDFVAAVSHELRTPIASVRMLGELLAEGRVDPDERAQMESALVVEARRLGETVDRLLGFGRMEAGRYPVHRATVAVAEVVDEAVATFRARHPEAEVRSEVQVGLEAALDPDAVSMALGNLLANAAKYAPEGQPYSVDARRVGRGVEIVVRDRGPGIARRDQRRIFRPFERAADRLSEATEGSGIGLSLVAHVARSHRGTVRVESDPGCGASFILWFPDAVESPR